MGLFTRNRTYFPELLVPGWWVDPQVHSRRAANNVKRRLGTKLGTQPNFDDASHVGILAGSYCLDENVRYTNEQIDNLYRIAFYFRGDDCDGSSMAAYALFTHEFGSAVFSLWTRRVEPRRVRFRCRKRNRGPLVEYALPKRQNFCNVRDDRLHARLSHFHTGAFAWTSNGATRFARAHRRALSSVSISAPTISDCH